MSRRRHPPSPLALRVKARMDALGLKQSDLARRSGLNRAFISDLVRGIKATVREDSLVHLARALSTSAAFLTGETDNPQPPHQLRPPRGTQHPILPA